MTNTGGMAAEKESGDCSPTKRGKNSGHFGTEGKVVPPVKRAEIVEREVPTEHAMPEFFVLFVETALHLVSRRKRKRVQKIIRLVSDANFGAGELRWHLKVFDGCKRLLDDSRNEKLAEKSFSKKI